MRLEAAVGNFGKPSQPPKRNHREGIRILTRAHSPTHTSSEHFAVLVAANTTTTKPYYRYD
jgi:hypothetical protein